MPKKAKSSPAFTLIELLVVIAIIGLLASIALVSLNSARAKGRDVKRLADIKELSKALEMYAADHGGLYPNRIDVYSKEISGDNQGGPVVVGGPSVPLQIGCGFCNRWCWLGDALKDYIGEMPSDPRDEGNYYYYYHPAPDGNNQYYGIGAFWFETNEYRQKYSNPNGGSQFLWGYELGPSVTYCLDKYTGTSKNWKRTGASPNTICWGGN